MWRGCPFASQRDGAGRQCASGRGSPGGRAGNKAPRPLPGYPARVFAEGTGAPASDVGGNAATNVVARRAATAPGGLPVDREPQLVLLLGLDGCQDLIVRYIKDIAPTRAVAMTRLCPGRHCVRSG